MEFRDLLKRRRMVRHYDGEPIPREALEQIAATVRRATDARYRALLDIPGDFTIVAGVTLGRPLPDPAWSRATSRATQRRRPLDEIAHWNRWST